MRSEGLPKTTECFGRASSSHQAGVLWYRGCFTVNVYGKKYSMKVFVELTQCMMLPLADVCWCPEIGARALVWYELNNSCMNINWTPTSQAPTGPTRDLDLFVMGLNRTPPSTEHDGSLPVAGGSPAQKAASVELHRREAQLVGRILLCWCVWGSDGLWGRTHPSTGAGVFNLCSVYLSTAPKAAEMHLFISLFKAIYRDQKRQRQSGG